MLSVAKIKTKQNKNQKAKTIYAKWIFKSKIHEFCYANSVPRIQNSDFYFAVNFYKWRKKKSNRVSYNTEKTEVTS